MFFKALLFILIIAGRGIPVSAFLEHRHAYFVSDQAKKCALSAKAQVVNADINRAKKSLLFHAYLSRSLWARKCIISYLFANIPYLCAVMAFVNVTSEDVQARISSSTDNRRRPVRVKVQGRIKSAEVIRHLLLSRNQTSVLDMNEGQQLVVEAWAVITSFYLYQDFIYTASGQQGWTDVLKRNIESLDNSENDANLTQLAHNAIESGLLPALGDRFAQFLRPEDSSELEDIESGAPVIGLGAVFVLPPGPVKEQPKVISVIPSSCAERAGVRYGDRLIAVDGNAVAGSFGADAGALIRGQAGTFVHVDMLREDGTRYQARLERVLTQLEPTLFRWLTVEFDALQSPQTVGYIRITTFAGPPVAAGIRNILGNQFVVKSPAGQNPVTTRPILVLDLRGNYGGRLDEAYGVADALVALSPPAAALAVLVDKDTASAAEALTAEMVSASRSGRFAPAVVVVGGGGSRWTFGKGEAQSKFELSDGSAVVLSVERFIPAGFTGVAVDLVLSPDEPDPPRQAAVAAIRLCHSSHGE